MNFLFNSRKTSFLFKRHTGNLFALLLSFVVISLCYWKLMLGFKRQNPPHPLCVCYILIHKLISHMHTHVANVQIY